jgi:hypothetical protein
MYVLPWQRQRERRGEERRGEERERRRYPRMMKK